jgi:uncharacterized membrane protein YadS
MILDEFYIKVSLVLLAMDLTSAKGLLAPSLFVSWIDTPCLVLIFYLIGTRIFKLDPEVSLITAATTSVCGTSAANAVGVTIKAPKESMFYPIAISSFFTVPLVPIMPVIYTQWFGKSLDWDAYQAGAWIGGW